MDSDLKGLSHFLNCANNYKYLKQQLKNGLDPNTRSLHMINITTESCNVRAYRFYLLDMPLIVCASAYSNYKCVRKLIEYGALIDATNNEELTSLDVASIMGCSNVTRLLLKCGANLNVIDSEGETLYYPIKCNNVDSVKLLLNAIMYT